MKSRILSLMCLLLLCASAAAQVTSGRLTGVVTDQNGALVPGADVLAVHNDTRAEFRATASGEGTWSIPSLPNGTYTISVSAPRFKTTVLKDVKVDNGQVATANAALQPGGAAEQVVIIGGGEILQTESPNISTTIAGRQISELPFVTRDALQLVLTLPGVQSPGVPRTSSINGLPKGSVNITLDGVNIQDNFLRSSDGFFTQVQMKSDAVEEVTVSTAVPGAESAGEGAAQIKGRTKSGTSEFHGGAFWQYRSPRFNSNYYFNTIDHLPKDSLFLRQMGGHIGGPIMIPHLLKGRDKAFFFVNWEEFRLPQAYGSLSTVGNILVLTPEARSGNFTFAAPKPASPNPIPTDCSAITGTTQMLCTRNLLTVAANNGFISTIDPRIAQGLGIVDTAVHTEGALKSRVTNLTNPSANDYNRLDYNFQDPGTNIRRFPTGRLDWNITKNHHIEFIHQYQHYYSTPDAVNGQNSVAPGQGIVIGTPGITGSIYRNSYSFAGAHRWTVNSNIANEARFTSGGNGTSLFTREFAPGLFSLWGGNALATGTYLGAQTLGTGAFYNRRSTSRRTTPTKGLSDNLTWVKGDHTINFGGSYLYIRSFTSAASTQVVPQVTLGINANDPAVNMFTTGNFPNANSTQLAQAQSLYAILVGRITAVNRSASLDGNTKKYVFDSFNEYNHQNEWAFYGQDSWKFRPNITLNYGLRWEFEPSPINDNLVYTRNGIEGIYGVSGVGNIFKPGTFGGQPTQYRLLAKGEKGYANRWHDFAPSFGFAYTPDFKTGLLGRLTGSGKTVIRGGYSIAFTREGFNAYTAMFGSNEGGTVTLNASPSSNSSIFGPAGSRLFRDPLPVVPPPADTSKYPFTPVFLSSGSTNDFDPNLKAGYTQSFSLGLQREIGKDTALEVRFVRTRGTHLWRQIELNEVNIFENGFINEFRNAANNLRIFMATNPQCGQSGQIACNYGNSNLPGQVNVPILSTSISSTVLASNTDQTTINRILQGQAGAVANSIAFNLTRMNRLILANSGAGIIPWTSLPTSTGCDNSTSVANQTCRVSNFFVTNPQAAGGAFLMTQGTDTSFNALQVELRRRMSKGLLFQGSYQYGKALANAFVSSSSVFSQPRTLRNPSLDRTWSPWDIRHSLKFDFINELPFGSGHRWLNTSNGLVNRIVGGWQWSGVVRIQSGPATLLTSGGRATVNQNDSGVVLHNLTQKQFEGLVKIRKDPSGIVYWLPQNIIDNTIAAFASPTGQPLDANAPYIGPPLTPGDFGSRIVFHGPGTARFDFNILKRIPINERMNVEGRVSFLNAFNRANFYLGDSDSTIRSISAASSLFGQTRSAYRDITVSGTNDPGGRLVEFQLRFNF